MPFDRKRRILELVNEVEYISVNDLISKLQVSGSTIRNDLVEMETEGLIERVHGGVKRVEPNEIYASYANRLRMKAEEKKKIAEAAANLVCDNCVIGLDGSTTALYLARCLVGKDITVVTNGIYAAMELAQHRPTHVILIGGELNWELGCITGQVASTLLGPPQGGFVHDSHNAIMKVEQFFTSPGGITVNEGLMDINLAENYIKSLMISSAREVVALAHNNKIGRTALLSYAPLSAVSRLVTDNKADAANLDKIRNAGVDVIVAD